MNQEKPLYSYHIFLFPFKWKMDEGRTNPQNLNNFSDALKKENWKSILETKKNKSEDELENEVAYNEFVYFHPFAQEALYDVKYNDNIRQLTYDIEKENPLYYEIGTFDKKVYSLKIDTINLNLYSTGIGVLSFHLANSKKDRPNDYSANFNEVLDINNLGRRIYPPYLGVETERKEKEAHLSNYWIDYPKYRKSLADYIAIRNSEGKILAKEDFKAFQLKKNFQPPIIITHLLPQHFFQKYKIQHVLDERMFVMSWCGDGGIVETIKKVKPSNDYLKSNDWFRYLFVDGPNDDEVSANNNQFEEQLLKKHSYPRWIGGGTIYGVTRYSFIGLTNVDGKWLGNHFKTMYYKMVELCLMQRASLLQFSKRIADITHKDSPTENSKKTEKLSKDYLHFVNNIHFAEITPQEQGIELYGMLQDHLEIDRDRVELNQEIQELHNYMNILAEGQRSEALEMLTILGALLVLPSFILGYFGLEGVLGDDFAHNWLKIKWVTGLVLFVVLFSLGFSWYRQNPSRKIVSNISGVLALLLTIYAIYLPFSDQWDSWKVYEDKPSQTNDTIRIGQPIIIPIDSSRTIELNPDNFYFIQPKH